MPSLSRSRLNLWSYQLTLLQATGSTYEQLDDGRTVRVRGDTFRTSDSQGLPYQVKLEGARVLGYRSMYFGSLRDRTFGAF